MTTKRLSDDARARMHALLDVFHSRDDGLGVMQLIDLIALLERRVAELEAAQAADTPDDRTHP